MVSVQLSIVKPSTTSAKNTAPTARAVCILFNDAGITFGLIHLENSLPMVAPGGAIFARTNKGTTVPIAVNVPDVKLAPTLNFLGIGVFGLATLTSRLPVKMPTGIASKMFPSGRPIRTNIKNMAIKKPSPPTLKPILI